MNETRGLKSSANSAGAELLTIARADRGALRPLAGERSFEEMETALDRAREVLAEREIWHVTGSAVGGMAEVLGAILGYVRDGGINARWAKLRAGEEFFSITHRLYDGLYGSPSSGLSLRPGDRDIYERTLARTADSLLELIREGDIVVLHDPPTAGLVEPMREAGARVAWRCHLGIDRPSPAAEEAQRFLLPHVQAADAYVFSRREFVWPELEESKAWIVPPSINPLSPKNQELEPATVTAILDRIGLTADGSESPPTIDLLDGSPLRVDFPVLIEQVRPIPETSHVVAQLSNWDRLKDPQGLLKCFAEHCTGEIDLVLAGPDPTAIPEEPGSEELWAELVADVEALPDEIAERIHLLALPVEYPAGNAAAINAIQRRATVVVRKSFAEGFGLSLAEAMNKGRPVVATKVGGIQDLVTDGETGLLVSDPNDLDAFARAIQRVITEPELADRLAEAAKRRVQERYLIVRHLTDYMRLGSALAEGRAS